jgi:hypothetical protein
MRFLDPSASSPAVWATPAHRPGSGPDRLEQVASAPRQGFETAVTVTTSKSWIGVRAKDASGTVLGASEAVRPRD